MNFAFSAILIIIILLPGAAVLSAYYGSFQSKQSTREIPLVDLLIKGLLWSIFLHTSAICLLSFFKYEVSFDLIYAILTGQPIRISNAQATHAFRTFTTYTGLLIISVWVIVKFCKRIIYNNKFDINYYSLRITNYWYHIFSARYLEGRGVPGTLIMTDFLFLDVYVDTQMIYSGFLTDFNYSPKNDMLENIVLSNATIRKFEHYSVRNQIAGDVLVIPMANIKNINIYYIKVKDNED